MRGIVCPGFSHPTTPLNQYRTQVTIMSGQTLLICLEDNDLQSTPIKYHDLLQWSQDLGIENVHILVTGRCGIPGIVEFKRAIKHSNEWDYFHLKDGLSFHWEPDWVLVVNTNKIPDFLLLQSAYAEFSFFNHSLKHLTERKFRRLLSDFQSRTRKFGR